LAAVVLRHNAALGDHLIETAIKSRQGFGDEIRRVGIGGTRRCGRWRRRVVRDWRRRSLPGASLRQARMGHALELPGQVIETVMHRRKAILDVLIVDMVAI
jgi:hypothetical protein